MQCTFICFTITINEICALVVIFFVNFYQQKLLDCQIIMTYQIGQDKKMNTKLIKLKYRELNLLS